VFHHASAELHHHFPTSASDKPKTEVVIIDRREKTITVKSYIACILLSETFATVLEF
jgi:hypothetical protein